MNDHLRAQDVRHLISIAFQDDRLHPEIKERRKSVTEKQSRDLDFLREAKWFEISRQDFWMRSEAFGVLEMSSLAYFLPQFLLYSCDTKQRFFHAELTPYHVLVANEEEHTLERRQFIKELSQYMNKLQKTTLRSWFFWQARYRASILDTYVKEGILDKDLGLVRQQA